MPSPLRHYSQGEYNQRASTGSAVRRGDIKISDPIPIGTSQGNGDSYDTSSHEQSWARQDGSWSSRAPATVVHGRSVSSSQVLNNAASRISTGPSLQLSNISSTPSKTQGKETGFRATLRRIFSNKSKSGSQPTSRSTSIVHRDHGPRHQQTTSVNDHASQILSPLRQHAISVDTPFSATPQGIGFVPTALSEVEERESPSSRRRNTVPSIAVSPELVHGFQFGQGDNEPGSRPVTAIKQVTARKDVQIKRRSRSADALVDMLNPSQTALPADADRKSQIAYWRNSVVTNPLPPLDSLRRNNVTTFQNPPDDVLSIPRTRPSIEPVQEFDFDLDGEMVSARPPSRPVTLEERVNTLEVKLVDFEYALAKLQGIDLPRPQPQKRAQRSRSFPKPTPEHIQTPSLSSASSNDVSQASSFESPPEPEPVSDVTLPDRTSKATTIKPRSRNGSVTRPATSRSSVRLSQYQALLSMVHDEQIARKQLECQVMLLEKELGTLRSSHYLTERPTTEPTPSPESLYGLDSRRRQKRRRSYRHKTSTNYAETSRFSMTESDAGSESGEPNSDVFETPQEGNFFFDHNEQTFRSAI